MAALESPALSNSLPSPISDDDGTLRSSAQSAYVPGNASMAPQPEEDAAEQDPYESAEDQSHEPVARAADYWTRLDKLIGSLEDRVRNISEADKDRNEDSAQKDNPTPSGENNKGPSSFIPEVRYCNYHQFVNRYADDGEPAHAIEVLQSGNQLGKQIFDEWELRCGSKVEGYDDRSPDRPKARRHENNSEDTWIQRVRIQSPALIKVLGDVTNHGWGAKPHTFLRPFRYMIHFHEKFKERLAQMEEEAVREGDSGGLDETSITALEEMRCYVKFAEEEIVPEYYRFTDCDYDNPAKVKFHDLWYLFRPGELIYIPRDTLVKKFPTNDAQGIESITSSEGNQRLAALQTVWKLFFAYPKHGPNALMEEYDNDDEDFDISCYYYDYDGSTYAAVPYKNSFKITWFEGKKDVRDLEFYPIRFARDWQNVLAEGRLWGKRFTEYVETKHMFYSGWTVTHHPIGSPIPSPDGSGEVIRIPEHIESDIIVDFQEVFNNCPGWKLFFADVEMLSGHGGYDTYTNGRDAIITWEDRNRTKQLSSITEVVMGDDDIDTLEHDNVASKDHFLRAKTRTSKPKPEGDELALLPRRLFAYAIRERKFILVDLRHVKPVHEQADVFDKLEIRADYKRHILALVRSNFRNKDLDKEGVLGTQDLIRGKGKGVVILLHGAPGVGKTATAEAVAQKFGRPLFPITCGDLGFSPDTVEENLSEIFRLAHLWNCVLLLDEADVFLTARSPTDIKRNALVSVFLRILEYYNGVLFLTTNRVGKLDPAITSRVHLNLHYRRLQADEFRNVFNLNIEKLEQIEQQRAELFSERKLYILKDEILQFASDHFRATGSGRESWNGRQIRNAFLIASSLARYEAEAQGADFQPQLRASHFKEVETVTREFDLFRKHLKGGDDEEVARRKEERDDTWEEAESKMAGQQQPPPQGFQHGVKTYHSPGAQSNIPPGYPPAQADPSPHSTPSRSYAPGHLYSTPGPAHLSSGAPSNAPSGYPPAPRDPSPHSTPSRSYAPGPSYSTPAPAHLAPEYTHTNHHATPPGAPYVQQSRS